MIVITSMVEGNWYANSGDNFCLQVGDKIIIEETVSKSMFIDFVASFRFCLEDGTCVGNHLAGIFAKKAELPKEIREAKTIKDLTLAQQINFAKNVNNLVECIIK